MGGKGVPIGVPVGFYGLRNIGKSIISLQLTAKVASMGYKVIYLDTEAFLEDDVFERIMSWFKPRFELTDEQIKENIEVISVRDIFQLGRLFGMQYEIVQDQNKVSCIVKYPRKWSKDNTVTKTTRMSEKWLEYSPIYKKLEEEEEILVIVLDSITVPYKSKFSPIPQNFPARAFALESIWDPILVLSKMFNISFVVTNHGSKSPMSNYVTPWGGNDMLYFNKRWIGILDGLKNQRETYGEQVRRFYRHRWPAFMDDVGVGILKKDTGYVDLTQDFTKVNL